MSAGSGGADVRVICGPTAAGKTALAFWLAERHPSVIVSADSRQVYRGFDVGTAKPTREERVRVPHAGVDIAEPTERVSAAMWARRAETWIDGAEAAGRAPLVVGGTGLYLRALLDPLFEEPALDVARRRALERLLAPLPVPELRRWAAALDPGRARLGRTQLLRAVEIALLTGRRLSDLHVAHARPARRSARYLVVDPGPPLQERIVARVDAMLHAGWEEEVSRLSRSVPEEAPAWNSTGYRAVRLLVRGELTRAVARERAIVETRQYAKRQRTWFRHQLPAAAGAVTHLDPRAPGWADEAERWWLGDDTRTP